jgi:hypothetical protein
MTPTLLPHERATSSERQEGVGPAPLLLSAQLLDIGFGLLLLGVGIWFWVAAGDIASRSQGLMSPVAFPRGIALMLGGSALAMATRAALRRPSGHGALVTVERPGYVLGAFVMTIAYPLLIGFVGYYIATGLWLPPFLWIAGYRRPIGILACSAGFLLFTRIVFQQVLGTPLP